MKTKMGATCGVYKGRVCVGNYEGIRVFDSYYNKFNAVKSSEHLIKVRRFLRSLRKRLRLIKKGFEAAGSRLFF